MVSQGSPSFLATTLRCSHCGRPVCETWHTRSAYGVDSYSLFTGEVEPVLVKVEDDVPPMTLQRLLSWVEVVTCADCYRDPEVQRDRERRFRPELENLGTDD